MPDNPALTGKLVQICITEAMALERTKKQTTDHAKRSMIDAQVTQYRDRLEKEAFGLPAFDQNKNCTGGFNPPELRATMQTQHPHKALEDDSQLTDKGKLPCH